MNKKHTNQGYCQPASADQWNGVAGLFDAAQKLSKERGIAIVLVEKNVEFSAFWRPVAKKPWEGLSKVAVLWNSGPVDPAMVLSWRSALVEEGEITYRISIVPNFSEAGSVDWQSWLEEQLKDWLQPIRERESVGLSVGTLVEYNARQKLVGTAGYDPAFLTVSPSGSMSKVLDELDECKREFRNSINGKVGVRRENVLVAVDELLAFDSRSPKRAMEAIQQIGSKIESAISRHFDVDRNRLPRVLLLGGSGVGKTLVARYLAWRTSPGSGADERLSRPFKRVPIPEYLHKEDAFEFDVFGYTAGAFTGARTTGSRGFLLERMGGVVFFDEIGEASPAIQAKLLAYLDDYRITPRGWEGEPIFCPMLIVAATNRPIDVWAEKAEDTTESEAKYFRNDLFRRFNVIVRVPSLGERKSEIPFILDAMLQMEAFNPGKRVTQVGQSALEKLAAMDLGKGNFRTLEMLVRNACKKANSQRRDYLVKEDFEPS